VFRGAIDLRHEIGARFRFPVDGAMIGRAFSDDLCSARGSRDAGRQ